MLIRKKGQGSWDSPATTAYPDEASLQALLATSPELLPECDGSESVARELRVPETGQVDLVCVSPTGVITLVECKLQINPEIRRSIIGQIFAYAAGLWKLSYEEFDAAFQSRHGSSLADSFQGRAGWDEEEFRATVAANLESGALSLVLAVDSITDELKRIVSYLNTHMLPSVKVLAVELDYTAGHDVEILVPRTYGEETASSPGRDQARNWTEGELMNALEASCSPAGFKAAKRLFEFGRANDARFFFGKATSLQPTVMIWMGELHVQAVASYGFYVSGSSSTSVAVNFGWMRPYDDGSTLQRLLDRMRELPPPAAEILDHVDKDGFTGRPRLPIDMVLVDEQAQDLFERAILDVIQSGRPLQGC